FGVSLHRVDPGVDTGPIVAQRRIEYDWEDTGGTLFRRASAAMLDLVKEAYPTLRELNFKLEPQPEGVGSYHESAELDEASRIELDRTYTGRDLLNLLRARTFPPYPACYFSEGGTRYEVRVEITRKESARERH